MSRAIRAKTAKQRAKIAASFIRSGREPGRAFDDCFEMGDGDEVVAHLVEMCKRGPKLAARIHRYVSGFDKHGNYSGGES